VTVSGGGETAAPSTVTAATTIQQAADLNVASSHSGSFTQGDAADSYTLTVSNVKGPNAPGTGGPSLGLASVADSLPWGLTATGMSGQGWACDVTAVTCYRSDSLAAGPSYPPVTLTVSVADNAPASVTNSVTVSGGGMTSGPGSSTSGGGQTATDLTTITQTGPTGTPPPPPQAPDLSVTSTHSGAFTQGDAADSYTITVSNAAAAGPAAGLVTVTDSLPAGLTPARMTGDGWTCTLAPATLPGSPNTFESAPTCYRFGSLAPGASYPPITLAVAVANDTQPTVTNTAAVSGGGATNAGVTTDQTNVTQLPELAVTSFASAGGVPYAPFGQGNGASSGDAYHITVANNGYAATSGAVRLAIDLPAGLTALSMSGPGWSCQPATATCATNSGVTLAAGARSDITLKVGVSGDAPPSLQTLMQASGGGEVAAAGLNENNDYDVVSNGGAYVDPTYVTPGN